MSLRERRQALIERTDLRGDAFCRALSDAADGWLTELFDRAAQGESHGIALVAVGGYGRRELSPFSDLDVVLVHKGRRDVSSLADRIWYPVWDEGISLDHSVRKPSEVLDLAGEDLRVALGLLDGRVICGDARVADPVLTGARERWERQRPAWLPVLGELVAERHEAHGDVAFLLEPDLKESHGGLRDIAALGALMLAVPSLADYVDTAAIEGARVALTRVRVELHRRAGRALDKLLLQEQDQIAGALGDPDTGSMLAAIASAGRTVSWEADDAWRRQAPAADHGRRSVRRRRSSTSPDVSESVEPGIAVEGGEIVLSSEADVTGDSSLPLRVAAVAAERVLPISRDALNLLGRKSPTPAEPWSDGLRATLVRVLAAGPPAISTLEALDQRALFSRYLPEWKAVRNKPQRNPYHRFTVDRHLLETAANAATMAHRVERVDLLLVGALLHDIGKGSPGDHTEAGMVLAASIGARMGFSEADVTTLVTLVRLHLLLPEMATRRDLDDPATARRVADEVEDRGTLELLAVMVEADSIATGPSAWGPWKAGLMADLVERTAKLLAGERAPERARWLTDDLRVIMDTVRTRGMPALSVEGPVVTIVAPDRPGLLADVTGVLALRGLNVRSADVTGDDGIAVERFTAEPARGTWPDAARLAEDLAAVGAGQLALDELLAERAHTYRHEHRSVTPHLVEARVTVDNNASETASVVEVRAEDLVGQLHRITRTLGTFGLDVTSARVSTFGPAVVDAFYVRTASGGKLRDPRAIGALRRSVADAVLHAPDPAPSR